MTNKIILTEFSSEELKELISTEMKSVLRTLDFKAFEKQPQIDGIRLAEKITGYTRSSIYTMVSRGKIPHFKRDGRLLFNAEKLRQWLTEGETKSQQNSCVDYDLQFRNQLKKRKG